MFFYKNNRKLLEEDLVLPAVLFEYWDSRNFSPLYFSYIFSRFYLIMYWLFKTRLFLARDKVIGSVFPGCHCIAFCLCCLFMGPVLFCSHGMNMFVLFLRSEPQPRGSAPHSESDPPEQEEEILGSDDDEQEDPNDYCKGKAFCEEIPRKM